MKNLKKMVIPMLFATAGILEMTLHGFEVLVQEVGLPDFYVPCLRFASLLLTITVTILYKPQSFE